MKKFIALILTLVLTLGICACGTPQAQEEKSVETREFTDSCGRTVTVPAEVTKIAMSGPLTQIYVLPLCSDMIAGFVTHFAEDTDKYFPEEYRNLPELGQLYGGKGTMNLEALIAAAPDVVIDVGDAKDGIVEDMDALTEQTGIPFVHIDGNIETAPGAYRMLGELTGRTEKAEQLAVWCENTYARTAEMMERVDADGARLSALFCLGDKGLNVLAEGSFHAGTLNMLTNNAAKLADVVHSGDGNEVDFEQILLWDPDLIIFAPNSVYDSVGEDANWSQLAAIGNGSYVQTPYGPYGWLSSPPAVQCYLGMLWLGAILYPDYVDYNLQDEVAEYYKLFFSYELDDVGYTELTENAFFKN